MVKKLLKSAAKKLLAWPKTSAMITAGLAWVAGYFGFDLPPEELSAAVGGVVALAAALAFAKKKLPPAE